MDDSTPTMNTRPVRRPKGRNGKTSCIDSEVMDLRSTGHTRLGACAIAGLVTLIWRFEAQALDAMKPANFCINSKTMVTSCKIAHGTSGTHEFEFGSDRVEEYFDFWGFMRSKQNSALHDQSDRFRGPDGHLAVQMQRVCQP